MTHRDKLLSAVGLTVFAVIILLALGAYVGPAMLIDFANLRLCS